MELALDTPLPASEKRLNLFERYLTVWVTLCMVGGVVLGQSLPGRGCSLAKLGVWRRQPYQCSNRYPDLADDHSDDDEGRPVFTERCRAETLRITDHALCKLARETVFHGVPGLALLPICIFRLDQFCRG